MELISIEGATLTRLFQVNRPKGAVSPVAMLRKITERYSFSVAPTVEEAFDDKVIFNHGVFDDTAIDALDMYSDGVVIRARAHTDIIDAFFDDMDRWFTAEYGLTKYDTHRVNTNYETRVLVRADDGVLKALDKLRKIGSSVSTRLRATNNQDAPFNPFGFTLAPDPAALSGLIPTPFRIERRIGLAHELNYFVSTAPLRTSDHLEVLQELEAAFSPAT